jgi:hypothetical protein
MGLNNQAVREFNVTKFRIYSNTNGKFADITQKEGLFVNLHYYESILENQIKATAIIADTGYSIENSGKYVGLIEGLDLSGGEKVELHIEDGYGNQLRFSDERVFRIGRIRNKIEHTQNMVFVIDLVTEEFFKNELVETRVDEYFSGKISNSVDIILKRFLQTEKDLDIEDTENEYTFNGHTEKPFYKCTWLGKRSIPVGSTESSAGFFFFENYDGFKFKSIEKLLDEQRGYKIYIYNNTTELPVGYDGKILEAVPTINIDVQQKMMIGAYGSQVRTYDYYGTQYQQKEITYGTEDKKGINLAGFNLPLLPDDILGKPTRIISKMQPIGIMQPIDNENSKKQDYNVDQVTAQAASRYNQLFTIVLNIVIAGDFSHRAGDLIYCDFPELSNDRTQVVSGKNSGIYMIASLTQQLDVRDGAYTKLTLVRDSYGRKPFKR